MSEMVERVRQAIDDALSKHHGFEAILTNAGDAEDTILAAARAVIEALREPTREMLSRGAVTYGDPGIATAGSCWRKMIDAALHTEGDEKVEPRGER